MHNVNKEGTYFWELVTTNEVSDLKDSSYLNSNSSKHRNNMQNV